VDSVWCTYNCSQVGVDIPLFASCTPISNVRGSAVAAVVLGRAGVYFWVGLFHTHVVRYLLYIDDCMEAFRVMRCRLPKDAPYQQKVY
jgi:hypothetical protein